jgi:two-component system, OmpR family, sensor histidine kinase SenX3
MKLSFGDRLFSYSLVLVMTAVLVTLAVLQYRWSNQVSQATSERMEADLQTTLMRLREDLYRDIAGFCFRLDIDPEADAEERQRQYAQQYELWRRVAPYPGVVAEVYVIQEESGISPRLLRLDSAKRSFHQVDLPSRYDRLQERLHAISGDLAVASRHAQSTEELRKRQGSAAAASTEDDSAEPGRQFPVMIDQDVPALVQAVYHRSRHAQAAHPGAIDWVIVELAGPVLNEEIFPRLVVQYFGEARNSTYHIAIVRGSSREHPIYASAPDFPGKGGTEPDQAIRLFGPPFGPSLRGSNMILLPTYQGPEGNYREQNDLASAWPVRIEPIHYAADDEDWQMLARHRKGSLEAAVSDLKRRNLALSFAVLVLLAGSMGMLLVSSRRAHMLAKLQMDFVAAISHELRTPLSVICSAADNLADGVVGDQRKMLVYGGAIRHAARQLIHLVEQVLMYSATRNNRHRYNLAPLQVSDIVDAACANTSSLVEEAGVRLECYVDPKLPRVMGDQGALAHCLQNLITNAIKYGGEQRWVGIRARMGRDPGGTEEVQISVEDKGEGIEPRDLPHIFEPFYRTPAAVTSQVRGTGLGLALARTIAQAMGGKLTVSSVPGEGSSFVVHLPPAERRQAEPAIDLAPAISDKGWG